MLETILEMCICTIISLSFKRAIEDQDMQLNKIDQFSNGITLALLVSMGFFTIAVAHFTFVKSQKLQQHAKKEAMLRYQVFVEQATRLRLKLKSSSKVAEVE